MSQREPLTASRQRSLLSTEKTFPSISCRSGYLLNRVIEATQTRIALFISQDEKHGCNRKCLLYEL